MGREEYAVDLAITNGVWKDVRSYGSAFTAATINAAITDIGSDEATLLIPPGTWEIGVNVSFNTNTTVRIARGAVLNITGGIVTFSGQLESGLFQIFSGAASDDIVFGAGSVQELYPEWWGAKGDGVTDDSTAIQYCFDCVVNSNTYRIPIRFQSATYLHATGLTIPYAQGITIHGTGGYFTPSGSGHHPRVSILYYTGADVAFTIGDGAQNATGFIMTEMYIKGTVAATDGCYLNASAGVVIKDCTFGLFTKAGAAGLHLKTVHASSFYNCGFVGNYYGTYIQAATAETTTLTFYACLWHSSTKYGHYDEASVATMMYSPTFQNCADSAIKMLVDPSHTYTHQSFTIHGGYFTVNNNSIAGSPIDITGNSVSAAQWHFNFCIRDLWMGSPGAAQTVTDAFIKLEYCRNPMLDNIRFTNAQTVLIECDSAKNYELAIHNWDASLALTTIQNGAGGIMAWPVLGSVQPFTYALTAGLIHLNHANASRGNEVVMLTQAATTKGFVDYVGTTEAGATKSLTSWTAGNTIQGFVRIEINGTDYWMPFYDAPTS